MKNQTQTSVSGAAPEPLRSKNLVRKKLDIILLLLLLTFVFVTITPPSFGSNKDQSNQSKPSYPTVHKTINVKGLNIFYREAGPKDAPVILLLHGYPTSSFMFRNLIRDLSDKYHLIAPDYPGFGQSDQPPMKDFEYTFDNLANVVDDFLQVLKIEKFSMYLMDYGAPIGYRLAVKNPDRISSLIIQNGSAYEEGILEFWDPLKLYWKNKTVKQEKELAGFHALDGLKWQYTHGVKNPENISPDNWALDLIHLQRPENNEIQLSLFYDYQNNIKSYPSWQTYLRKYQPPTLIVWGKNDVIFPAEGAEAYKKDLKNISFHLLDTGHFALEEEGKAIAKHIHAFFQSNKIK